MLGRSTLAPASLFQGFYSKSKEILYNRGRTEEKSWPHSLALAPRQFKLNCLQQFDISAEALRKFSCIFFITLNSSSG